MELIAFLLVHVNTISICLASLHGLAVVIVNLTPTPADDIILGKIYKVVELIAGVVTKTAKASPANRLSDRDN